MPINRVTIGEYGDMTSVGSLRAALSEFIATFLFIFAGQGSVLAYAKLTGGAAETPAGLIAAALGYGLSLVIAVSVGANNSGGHVNPAVTFGAFVGGHISLFRGIVYWIAQLLGSVFACFLLAFCTGSAVHNGFGLVSGVSLAGGLVFEAVMTFGLVYTVYATAVDPRKGTLGAIAPLAIGLVVVANILAGGAFTGASMNPAVAFGPALVSGNWAGHWVYWVGPLVGGGLAALVYQVFFICHFSHEQLSTTERIMY